ncbi:DUF4286 family protein [Jiangella asiatica]|uniref:DUF4286 family protein n=1 Tax=Jiangella asiatica TaxID=2530372 RepID=A0A4R5DIQ4_9ACTN|nr:DUF4286 family protein [Jiangella asiatica]TDE11814.1 hypothetical protein E1269_08605 [Jiangella asiatica]
MTEARGLLLVMIDIEPEHEEEFNRWYDEEHLPERLHCAGFLNARRFVAVEGSPKYLAIYELESAAVLEDEAYKRIEPPSTWTTRISRHFVSSLRNVYVEITPPPAPEPPVAQRP